MAITYNKKLVTKDRRIMPSGPRDRQMKHQIEKTQSSVFSNDSALVDELRNQISVLQKKIDRAPSGAWTDEQVNDEIMKAIKVETSDLKAKYKIEASRVSSLDKEVASLKEIIKEKNSEIKEFKEHPVSIDNNVTHLLAEATKKIETLSLQIAAGSNNAEILDPDRPQMEAIFVDPIENEAKIEKHFEVEDISVNEKDQMENKVSKLKNLMGSLPLRRG